MNKTLIIVALITGLIPTVTVIIVTLILRRDLREVCELKAEIAELRIQLHAESHMIQQSLAKVEARQP